MKKQNKCEDFEEVKRYKCKWCGEEFKTNTRHCCKFNPVQKNCFSCKHCMGFEVEYGEFNQKEPYVICNKDHEFELHDLYIYDWNLDGICEDYEEIDDYKGKESYCEKLSKMIMGEAIGFEKVRNNMARSF